MNRRYGHSAAPDLVLSAVSPVRPHARGMQPPPNDSRSLSRELVRLRWAIRGLLMRRTQLALVLDRYDQRLVAHRREADAYADALFACDPDAFARAESATEGWLDARGHVAAAVRNGVEVDS